MKRIFQVFIVFEQSERIITKFKWPEIVRIETGVSRLKASIFNDGLAIILWATSL